MCVAVGVDRKGADLARSRESHRLVLKMLTVFFALARVGAVRAIREEIDRSLAIDAETSLNSNRANFPSKS
jgi:hypothetical protein